MKKIVVAIEGMSCSACSIGLEKYLKKQKGIIDVSVNLVMAEAFITYEDNISIDDINKMIKDCGFKSLGEANLRKEKNNQENKKILITFSILSIIVLYISMSHMLNLPPIPYLSMMKYPVNYSLCLLIFTIIYLIYGFDIFKNGYKNLIHKTPNMDTLVMIGVLSSFIYSLINTILIILGKTNYVENLYFESACIVIYFIKLGRYIDKISKDKTKSAITDLVQITPTKAYLYINGKTKEVTIDEVKVGDILLCKSGQKIAVDGIITSGSAYFDESFLTGESMPIKKSTTDKVMAGSINMDGVIKYEAKKIGANSTISEIVHLVIESMNSKAPIARIADKVSSIFVPVVFLIALFTLVIYLLLGNSLSTSLIHFVSILVVACPCALGLAAPLAIVVAEGLCAKNGILVKTSEVLENASHIKTVVFDKTGTLTYGKLRIDEFINKSTYKDSDFLDIVSSLENTSTHPIATAFLEYKNTYKVTNYKNIAGIGFSANINNKKYLVGNSKVLTNIKVDKKLLNKEKELSKRGNSIIYIIEDNKVIGLIGVRDIIRDSSYEVINTLKSMNKEVVMLTGDNEITAKVIAKDLGIDKVISGVMPKDKEKHIKELKNKGPVMMIGDGINDAPSLVEANIGLSISSGTDIANNAADVILMNDNLLNIINLFIISKKTIINIKENLFWAFFYNICMIPLAIGLLDKYNIYLNPMIGSFAMTFSSLTVILNALTLKKIHLRR